MSVTINGTVARQSKTETNVQVKVRGKKGDAKNWVALPMKTVSRRPAVKPTDAQLPKLVLAVQQSRFAKDVLITILVDGEAVSYRAHKRYNRSIKGVLLQENTAVYLAIPAAKRGSVVTVEIAELALDVAEGTAPGVLEGLLGGAVEAIGGLLGGAADEPAKSESSYKVQGNTASIRIVIQ